MLSGLGERSRLPSPPFGVRARSSRAAARARREAGPFPRQPAGGMHVKGVSVLISFRPEARCSAGVWRRRRPVAGRVRPSRRQGRVADSDRRKPGSDSRRSSRCAPLRHQGHRGVRPGSRAARYLGPYWSFFPCARFHWFGHPPRASPRRPSPVPVRAFPPRSRSLRADHRAPAARPGAGKGFSGRPGRAARADDARPPSLPLPQCGLWPPLRRLRRLRLRFAQHPPPAHQTPQIGRRPAMPPSPRLGARRRAAAAPRADSSAALGYGLSRAGAEQRPDGVGSGRSSSEAGA